MQEPLEEVSHVRAAAEHTGGEASAHLDHACMPQQGVMSDLATAGIVVMLGVIGEK